MIWATVSSCTCFCWLYTSAPSLAAKNIINLISVLTIWWGPCVESSLVVGRRCLLWPVCSLGRTLLDFALLASVLQGKICLLLYLLMEMAMALQYSCLENPMDGRAWWVAVYQVAQSRTRLSNFTFTFHFHALEKEMATHYSVLSWRIPGTGEPGELPSTGLHRVRYDWSDLVAAAAAAVSLDFLLLPCSPLKWKGHLLGC